MRVLAYSLVRVDSPPQMRYVFDFDEDSGGGRELLGGKGVGLAEMTQLGIPVPAGFTITTDACRAYMAVGGDVPDGLDDEVTRHVEALEERTGKRFGDSHDPLLVSVRSGAAISMPGMMDTVLNLGLSDVAVEGLAESTGNARFAYDSYRRLIQMYGEVVEGVDGQRFEQALTDLKGARGVTQDVDLTADDLRGLVETFKEIYEEATGHGFAQDAGEQLRRAYRAVFDSWDAPRARVYRRTYEIPDDLGTAVNVVQMVFGNRGESSGTGVCFTRDPATGEKRLFGEFLANAQGEDVVAGIRTPEPIERDARADAGSLRAARPDPRAPRDALSRPPGRRVHGRGGNALPAPDAHGQTNGRCSAAGSRGHGRRGPHLEGGSGRADRPGPARPAPASPHRPEARRSRSRRRASTRHPVPPQGAIVLDADTAEERGKAGEDVILVRWETTPDDIHGRIQAPGVLTAHGGMTSHAAVVARGMGKPCVAGCEGLSIDVADRNGHARRVTSSRRAT